MSNAKKGVLGAFLLIAEALGKKSIGIVSTLILARVLVPEDFGVVAITTLIMGFIDALADTGANQYLQRCETVTDKIVNSAWTLNILIKAPILGLLLLFSSQIALYFDDFRVEAILYVLSAASIFGLLQNPGLIYLRRELEFGKIVKNSLIAKLVGVTVAISIALYFESYWALVLGTTAEIAATTIGSFFVYSYKPRFSTANLREQWNFSAWMIPQSILGYFRTQLDTFLVSNQSGTEALGSYHVLKYISFLPCSQILLPATKPLLVSMTKIKGNKQHFSSHYNMTFFLTMVIAGFISGFLFCRSEIVIGILLGESWVEYAFLLKMFAFLIPSFASLNHVRRLLLIHGKTNIMFYFEIGSVALFVMSIMAFNANEVKDFAFVRVVVEAVAVHFFLIAATVFYHGWWHAMRLLVGLTPILLSLVAASIAIDELSYGSNLIIRAVSDFFIFSISFLVALFISYYLLFHKMEEWRYLFSLARKLRTNS